MKFDMIDNPVTAGIAMGIGLLVVVGVGLVANGLFIWPVMTFTSALAIIVFGWTEHGLIEKDGKKVPITGFLTFLGKPWRIGGKCITVNSSVILAPWLGITSIKVDMTPVTVSTTVDVLSTEKNENARIQYSLNVLSTIAPDPDNLDEFITYGNGKVEKITEDYKGLAIVEAEIIAHPLSIFSVAESGSIVSNPLEEKMEEIVRGKKMGIIIKFVKAECKLPTSIAASAEEILIAQNKSKARVHTAVGMDEVARQILKEANRNRGSLPPLTYDEACKLATTTAVLEQGDLKREQLEIIAPPGTTVNFFGPVGGKGKKDKDAQK